MRRLRGVVFGAGVVGFAAVFLLGLSGLPPVGRYRGPYGDVINQATVPERHVADAVTAVNFDYRGFDTLGEEFILFASVIGALLLLRKQPDERREAPRDRAPDHPRIPPSDAVRVLSLALIGPTLVFGIYIVTHGQCSPGGGFQGGVIVATALLQIYLTGDFVSMAAFVRHRAMAFAESAGAGGYALIGLVGLAAGGLFLQNVLPLGQTGTLLSGGTVPLISLAVGFEVAAGFALLLRAFLEETLELRLRGGR